MTPERPQPASPQRRAFLQRAELACGACLCLALLPSAAMAQPAPATRRNAIHRLSGEVRVNERLASIASEIRPGDRVRTGPDGEIAFSIGADAFQLRSRSELAVDGSAAANIVAALRLTTGALAAVFGRGAPRSVVGPTVTAGIRGTGVYMQTGARGTYVCACFGTVDLAATRGSRDRLSVQSTHHHAHWALGEATPAGSLEAAPMMFHTDEEMDGLEQLVGRRAPWVPR